MRTPSKEGLIGALDTDWVKLSRRVALYGGKWWPLDGHERAYIEVQDRHRYEPSDTAIMLLPGGMVLRNVNHGDIDSSSMVFVPQSASEACSFLYMFSSAFRKALEGEDANPEER
jgi:hypothetical protein